MTNDRSADGAKRPLRLTIRTQRTIEGDGAEAVASTVYCPVKEHSVAVVECEGCNRFHSLHFDPSARTTSVLCDDAPPAERATGGGATAPDPATPLAELMTPDVVCVRADVDLAVVREIMVERAFGGVPVVDADGKPVGIVSRADLLRADRDRGDTEEVNRVTAQPKDRDDLGLGQGFHVYEPAKLTAGDVMSPLVLTLHEGSNVGQASALMAYEGVHRLPVIADDGRVVGILSSLDVLRWFGRRSGYLIPPGNAHRHA